MHRHPVTGSAAIVVLALVFGVGAEEIARKSMAIAAKICVYTNDEVVIETLDATK